MSQDDQSTRGAADPSTESSTDDQSTSLEPAGSAEGDERQVSHKTYRQTVAEAKAAKLKARQLEDRLKSIEDERLEAAGQKDELIKSLRSKLDGETKRAKEITNSFARKSLNAQLRAAAAEAGCIDPEAVMALADLSSVEVSSETFEADDKEVRAIINDLRKSKSYLFSKPGPNVNARMPGGARVTSAVDFTKMSTDEIKKWLREHP